MYGLVETQISSNDWQFHLLMASFLFMVTIMLNILIGMRTLGENVVLPFGLWNFW
jgi:hypothetical protein